MMNISYGSRKKKNSGGTYNGHYNGSTDKTEEKEIASVFCEASAKQNSGGGSPSLKLRRLKILPAPTAGRGRSWNLPALPPL